MAQQQAVPRSNAKATSEEKWNRELPIYRDCSPHRE
jgi:hypothetical protein